MKLATGLKLLVISCIVILLSAAFVSALSYNRIFVHADSNSPGVVIPLYTYPTDGTWATVAQVKQAYPSVPIIAVINPNSGPGNSKDSNYATGITKLIAAGVTVIGYVPTGYGVSSYSPVSNIENEIDQYKSWYPNIQGIFFDEMSSSASEASYYSTIANYAVSSGLSVTVGNPGTIPDPSLLGILSILCIYENPGMPSAATLDQLYSSYGSSGFSYIAYGVSSLPNQQTLQSVNQYVSYVYISDASGSNPYDVLPSYFSAEVAALASSAGTETALIVNTVDQNGKAITGYYISLFQNAVQIKSGYSPATFAVQTSTSYTVKPENYGSYLFACLLDNSSTVSSETITLDGKATLTAVYSDTVGLPSLCDGNATTSTSSSTIATTNSTTTSSSTTTTQNHAPHGVRYQIWFSPI